MAHGIQITFDAADPPALARFWALALDYVQQPPPPGYGSWAEFGADHGLPASALEDYGSVIDPDEVGPRLFFQRVPEPKTAKNRVHIDINVTQGSGDREEIAEHVSRLVEAGATRLGEFEELGSYWIVMQDPEGNEFCVS